MRIGMNPFKSMTEVAQPEDVTVAVLVHIPFLSGYYTQSLDVLRLCLASILENTDLPFDLMVFDNGSCPEVVTYLKEMLEQGHIQCLVLSERNIGKNGAWNFMFGAAPGRYIAYADGDVFFHPNWLSEHLRLFEAFPDVGTVTGFPHRRNPSFCDGTTKRAETDPSISVVKGDFIPQEWIDEFVYSLGKDPVGYWEKVKEIQDVRLCKDGVYAYAAAGHFQFVVQKDVIKQFLPFPSRRPVGADEHFFDEAMDGSGYLRLATTTRLVEHIGNTLTPKWVEVSKSLLSKVEVSKFRKSRPRGIWAYVLRWRPIRTVVVRGCSWALVLCHRILILYHDQYDL